MSYGVYKHRCFNYKNLIAQIDKSRFKPMLLQPSNQAFLGIIADFIDRHEPSRLNFPTELNVSIVCVEVRLQSFFNRESWLSEVA